jgi:hypothetical protein
VDKKDPFAELAEALTETADKPKPVETVESIRAEMVELFAQWVYQAHQCDLTAICGTSATVRTRNKNDARMYRSCAMGLRTKFNLPVRSPLDIERRRSSESENDYQARIRRAP